MCTNFDIHIVNGRCGKDSYVGEFSTVKDSVVDYVLLSSELFQSLMSFEVYDFDPLCL